MGLIQVIYCCRHRKGCLWTYVAFAAMCALLYLANASTIFRFWSSEPTCWGILFPEADVTNECQWILWGTMNALAGTFWLCTALCLCFHLLGNRHDQLLAEMYTIPPVEATMVLSVAEAPVTSEPSADLELAATQPVAEVTAQLVEVDTPLGNVPIISGNNVVLVSNESTADNVQ